MPESERPRTGTMSEWTSGRMDIVISFQISISCSWIDQGVKFVEVRSFRWSPGAPGARSSHFIRRSSVHPLHRRGDAAADRFEGKTRGETGCAWTEAAESNPAPTAA